jgi:hypothetical protein
MDFGPDLYAIKEMPVTAQGDSSHGGAAVGRFRLQ